MRFSCQPFGGRFKEFIIKEANTDEPIRITRDGTYLISDEKGDIIITPVFEKFEGSSSDDEFEEEDLYVDADPWRIDKTTGYTGKLRLYSYADSEKELSASNWKLVDDGYDNDKFSIDKDGNLSSVKELNLGYNWIYVSCDYNNKTIEFEVSIVVGSEVEFYLYLGQLENGGHISRWITGSAPFLGEQDFEKVCKETTFPSKYGFFGNFELDRWDKYQRRAFTEVKGNVSGVLSVYARYINKDTGKLYAPVIERLDATAKPDNKPTTKPSGGSSSSSSSSDSSDYYDPAVLHGNWKSDSNGWKFLQRNGKYATNSWGIVDSYWYYFGSDGYIKTGWIYWNGDWYYLNPESDGKKGQMKTGWVFDKALGCWFNMDSTGKMRVGWQLIDGKWYYFKEVSDGTKGVMMADTWIGNYYVDSTGAWDQSKKK